MRWNRLKHVPMFDNMPFRKSVEVDDRGARAIPIVDCQHVNRGHVTIHKDVPDLEPLPRSRRKERAQRPNSGLAAVGYPRIMLNVIGCDVDAERPFDILLRVKKAREVANDGPIVRRRRCMPTQKTGKRDSSR